MMHKRRLASAFSLALLAGFSSIARAQSQTVPNAGANQVDVAEHVRRFEANAASVSPDDKEPALQLSLAQVMEAYKMPGVSIAIIDNFQVVSAKGYGVITPGSQSPITPRTLFQAGSISKPVAATAVLYLVEHGTLVLDENVNDKLKTWKVPDNEFTKTEKVTLRRLLSHTAGLTVHGFRGYDVDEPLPTIVQTLNGEKPANSPPVRVEMVPGTKYQYSGGGVTIEQLLLMDVTNKKFPDLLREVVLDKLGMADSSYEQPLPSARAAMTAGGTYSDGKDVHGKWHVYPEMAAAGLWTTPTDLAHFAIETALSKKGKSNRVLTEKMTREMLTPVLDEAGLGFFIDKDNPGVFGHNGADEGFQAILTMNADTGKGVVIMANSDALSGVSGYLVRSVAREFGWYYKSAPRVSETLYLIAKVKGWQTALQRYDELKKAPSPAEKIEESTLNDLGYRLLSSGQAQDAIGVFQRNVELYPQSFNVYDSLGEAYADYGQKALAIENYEKSVQLNPKNQNGIDWLKKLKAQE